MRINKQKDTALKTAGPGISFGGSMLAECKQQMPDGLKEKKESEEEIERGAPHPAQPQTFMRSREKRKWNRTPPKKKAKFLKQGEQKASHFKKSGLAVNENEKQREAPAAQKKAGTNKDGLPNWKHTGIQESAGKGVQEGTKTAASAGSGGVFFVIDKALKSGKKTAEQFRESLQSQNIREKAEAVKEANKDRDSFTKMGMYYGAAVGILLAPLISVAMTAVMTLVTSILAILIPVIAAIALIAVVVSLIVALFGSHVAATASQGHFGAKWYWIEYETGKTDDTAFATVLGDNGAAFGIQFDYRYTLQGFMDYCYTEDPVRYNAFLPFLFVEKETLRGSQELADTWTQIFNAEKNDFIQKQKDFTDQRYYLPAEEKLKNAGIRIEDRSEVCKGAVLSFMFQGCRMGITAAVSDAGITNETSDEDFIRKLYQYRREHYTRFENRYVREEQTALALLSGGTGSVIVGEGYLCNPCPGARISSEFGYREAPTAGATSNHHGRDYAAPSGTPIYASADGIVEKVSYNGARGHHVIVDHGNGLKTWYQHCSLILTTEGEQVMKGQNIARVGSTGIVTGPHLHFEVHENGAPVDPRNYL